MDRVFIVVTMMTIISAAIAGGKKSIIHCVSPRRVYTHFQPAVDKTIEKKRRTSTCYQLDGNHIFHHWIYDLRLETSRKGYILTRIKHFENHKKEKKITKLVPSIPYPSTATANVTCIFFPETP